MTTDGDAAHVRVSPRVLIPCTVPPARLPSDHPQMSRRLDLSKFRGGSDSDDEGGAFPPPKVPPVLLDALKQETFSHGVRKKTKKEIEKENEERKRVEEEKYARIPSPGAALQHSLIHHPLPERQLSHSLNSKPRSMATKRNQRPEEAGLAGVIRREDHAGWVLAQGSSVQAVSRSPEDFRASRAHLSICRSSSRGCRCIGLSATSTTTFGPVKGRLFDVSISVPGSIKAETKGETSDGFVPRGDQAVRIAKRRAIGPG